jgi:hypothetical protein
MWMVFTAKLYGAESWGAFWGWGHAPQLDFASAYKTKRLNLAKGWVQIVHTLTVRKIGEK